jgi:hypothetical protein
MAVYFFRCVAQFGSKIFACCEVKMFKYVAPKVFRLEILLDLINPYEPYLSKEFHLCVHYY